MRQLWCRLRADVEVLGLESCKSLYAVTDLWVKAQKYPWSILVIVNIDMLQMYENNNHTLAHTLLFHYWSAYWTNCFSYRTFVCLVYIVCSYKLHCLCLVNGRRYLRVEQEANQTFTQLLHDFAGCHLDCGRPVIKRVMRQLGQQEALPLSPQGKSCGKCMQGLLCLPQIYLQPAVHYQTRTVSIAVNGVSYQKQRLVNGNIQT